MIVPYHIITIAVAWLLALPLTAQVTVTSTAPNVVNSTDNIDSFEITLQIDDESKIDLGDYIDIQIPQNLPKLFNQSLDDGKFYVKTTFKNKEDVKYKDAPGVKVTIYDNIISIKFTSKIQTFIQDDEHENRVPLSQGDTLHFELSTAANNKYKALPQYAGKGVIKISTNSKKMQIFNQTLPIPTPSLELLIKNPAVIFDKIGLGAKSNPSFSFFLKDGLPKNVRVEIIFPKGFNINAFNNIVGYVVINKKYGVQMTKVKGQILSFIVPEAIKDDNINITLISSRIINTTDPQIVPFKIKLYKSEEEYRSQVVYPDKKSKDAIYYHIVDGNGTDYHSGDEIHFEFTHSVNSASLQLTDYIKLEHSGANKRRWGGGYQILPKSANGGYAKKYRLILGQDVNLTSGLEFTFKKDGVVSKDGIKALQDVVFRVPNLDKTLPEEKEKTIFDNYNKLFAQNDIDMLYESMDHTMPQALAYNDLLFIDKDESESYSARDELILSFSREVYVPYITNPSSVVTIAGEPDLGDSFQLTPYQKGTTRLYSAKYRLILGTNPSLQKGDIIGFSQDKVLADNGSVPTYDVIFSPLPSLAKPQLVSDYLGYEDIDNNGQYSPGDKIFFEFTEPIKPLLMRDVSIENGHLLDPEYILYASSIQGVSKKIVMKLGDDTQLAPGDIVLIAKNKVISKHSVKAGLNDNFRMVAPALTMPILEKTHFNSITHTLHIIFNEQLANSDRERLLDNITISYDDKRETLKDMGRNIIHVRIINNAIEVVFSDKLIPTIKKALIGLKIAKETVSIKTSGRSNDAIESSFYLPTGFGVLLPNQWNLVAIRDKGVDTTLQAIRKKDDTAKERVKYAYVFDSHTLQWLTDGTSVVKRGDAVWLLPYDNQIDTVTSIAPQQEFTPKTSLLTFIMNMELNSSNYLGHSVADCTKGDKFSKKDLEPIIAEDINVSFYNYNAIQANWSSEITEVKPCQGFMVIKR